MVLYAPIQTKVTLHFIYICKKTNVNNKSLSIYNIEVCVLVHILTSLKHRAASDSMYTHAQQTLNYNIIMYYKYTVNIRPITVLHKRIQYIYIHYSVCIKIYIYKITSLCIIGISSYIILYYAR